MGKRTAAFSGFYPFGARDCFKDSPSAGFVFLFLPRGDTQRAWAICPSSFRNLGFVSLREACVGCGLLVNEIMLGGVLSLEGHVFHVASCLSQFCKLLQAFGGFATLIKQILTPPLH